MTPEEGIAVILLLWRRKKRRRLVECVALLRLERPLVPSDRLNLQILNDADCESQFRFNRDGIMTLAHLLRLPTTVITSAGDRSTSIEALAITLNRLAYPTR
ncbi:TPA: hypothetical protein N0F65_009931, partial [Lagenidium giganteum]